MKRMRFIIPVLIIISLLVMTFSGCLPKAPATPIVTKSPADEKQTKDISDLQALVNKKANSDTTAKHDERIKALEDQSSVNAYPKTQTYTKDQVDIEINNAIATAIANLKNNQDWIENNSSSSSSSSSGNELLDSDGDLELWLEDVNPSSDPMHFYTGIGRGEFDLVVKNKSNDSHRFRIEARFTPEWQVKIEDPTLSNTSIVSYPNVLGAFSITRGDWTTENLQPVHFNQATNRFIGDGDEDEYTLIFTFNTLSSTPAGGVFWSYKLSIEEWD